MKSLHRLALLCLSAFWFLGTALPLAAQVTNNLLISLGAFGAPSPIFSVSIQPLSSQEINGTFNVNSPQQFSAIAYPTITNGYLIVSNQIAGIPTQITISGYTDFVTNYCIPVNATTNSQGLVVAGNWVGTWNNQNNQFYWSSPTVTNVYATFYVTNNIGGVTNTTSVVSTDNSVTVMPSTNANNVTYNLSVAQGGTVSNAVYAALAGSSSNLIGSLPLAQLPAQAVTNGQPTFGQGLVLWLNAAQAYAFNPTLTNGSPATISDLSTSNQPVTQLNGSQSLSFSGMSVPSFKFSNTMLAVSNLFSGGGSNWTITATWRDTGGDAAGQTFLWGFPIGAGAGVTEMRTWLDNFGNSANSYSGGEAYYFVGDFNSGGHGGVQQRQFGQHVSVFVYNGATSNFWCSLDGKIVQDTRIENQNTSGRGWYQATNFFIGTHNTADSFFQGYVSDFRVYNTAISDSYRMSLENYLCAQIGLPQNAIIWDGDSIQQGLHTTTVLSSPSQILAQSFPNWLWNCVALSGRNSYQCLTNAYQWMNQPANGPRFAVNTIGVNDFHSLTGQTALQIQMPLTCTNILNYALCAQSNGIPLALGTAISLNWETNGFPSYDWRSNLNVFIRTLTNLATIIDYSANSPMGTNGAYTLSYYYADQVHPVSLGYTNLTAIALPVLQGLISPGISQSIAVYAALAGSSSNLIGSLPLAQLPAQAVTNGQPFVNYLPAPGIAFQIGANTLLEGAAVIGTNVWMSWRSPSEIQAGYFSGTNIIWTATNYWGGSTTDVLALCTFSNTIWAVACTPGGATVYTNIAAVGFDPTTLAVKSFTNLVGLPPTNYIQGFSRNPVNGLVYFVDYLLPTNCYVFDSSFNYQTNLSLTYPGIFHGQGIACAPDGIIQFTAGGPGDGFLAYTATTNGTLTQLPIAPLVYAGETEGCCIDGTNLYVTTRTAPWYLWVYNAQPEIVVDTRSRSHLAEVMPSGNAASIHLGGRVSGVSRDPVDDQLLQYIPFTEQIGQFGFLDVQSGLVGQTHDTNIFTQNGVLGNGGFFSASSSDCIQFEYIPPVLLNTNLSINTWLRKTNGVNGAGQEVIGCTGTFINGLSGIWLLRLFPPSTIELQVITASGSGYSAYAIDGAVTNGLWHMITGTCSYQSGLSVYVDGQIVTNVYPNTITLNSRPDGVTAIGGIAQLSGSFFTGWMDEFKIWGRTLSAYEVARIYNQNTTNTASGSGISAATAQAIALQAATTNTLNTASAYTNNAQFSYFGIPGGNVGNLELADSTLNQWDQIYGQGGIIYGSGGYPFLFNGPTTESISNNQAVGLALSGNTNGYFYGLIQNASTNGAAETGWYLNKPGILGDSPNQQFGLYYNSPLWTNNTGGAAGSAGLFFSPTNGESEVDLIYGTGPTTNSTHAWGISTASNLTNINMVLSSSSLTLNAGAFTGSGAGLTGIPTAAAPALLDDYMSIDQQDPYDQSTVLLPQINGSYYGVGKLMSAGSQIFYFASTRWPAIQWSGLTNQVLCVHIFTTNGATVNWQANVRYWTNGLTSGSGSGVQDKMFATGVFQCSAGVTNDYWITATNNWPLGTMTNVTMTTFYLGAGSPSTNVWVIQGTHIHAQ